MKCRSLLVIDQQPLFDAAVEDCRRACRKFEELRAELERHESRDVPAYDRWRSGLFGELLAEAASLARQVREKEQTLERLRKRHWARFFEGEPAEPSYAEAGMGFDDEGAHESPGMGRGYFEGIGEGSPHEDDDLSDPRASGARGFQPGAGARRGFRTGLWPGSVDEDFRFEPGTGPGFEDSGESGEFGTFEHSPEGEEGDESGEEGDEEDAPFVFRDGDDRSEEYFVRGGERRSGGGYRSRGPRDPENGDFRASGSYGRAGAGPAYVRGGGESPVTRDPLSREGYKSRLKERYRRLVRRLHPDLNPDSTLEMKRLWHQGQTAYREEDLDQLDLLLALADALAGQVTVETGLGQIRLAHEEIRRSIAALARKLEEARAHRAWRFSTLTDVGRLEREVERELRSNIAAMERGLREFDAQMRRFSAGAPARMSEADAP